MQRDWPLLELTLFTGLACNLAEHHALLILVASYQTTSSQPPRQPMPHLRAKDILRLLTSETSEKPGLYEIMGVFARMVMVKSPDGGHDE